jgi:hypothetical protein
MLLRLLSGAIEGEIIWSCYYPAQNRQEKSL